MFRTEMRAGNVIGDIGTLSVAVTVVGVTVNAIGRNSACELTTDTFHGVPLLNVMLQVRCCVVVLATRVIDPSEPLTRLPHVVVMFSREPAGSANANSAPFDN